MERCKSNVPGLSQTSESVMNGEESRQPVHRRSTGLTIRVRGMECVLADIQAQIQMLRQERTYLRLVRGELTGMEAKRGGLHRATPRRGSRLSAGSLSMSPGTGLVGEVCLLNTASRKMTRTGEVPLLSHRTSLPALTVVSPNVR